MNRAVKWAAKLAHVREVSILGTADLSFWKDRLRNEDLLAAESDGQAQLLVIACDSMYRGVRFRELSVSILVSRPEEGPPEDAAYLVRAWNSNRLFAFVERVFFSTPYEHGEVRVSASLPASIHLVKQGKVVFVAEMGVDDAGLGREPVRRGEDGWEGPVFLPQNSRIKGGHGKVFFARLRGDTWKCPFLPSSDSLTIRPSSDSDVLQMLRNSHFVAQQWIVREDATHAKSKTYKRTEVL